jgi:hypothetical protein
VTSLPSEESLRAADRRLQAAQLGSEVAVLDELLDARLVFTGPDGLLYGKDDDLHLHRSGEQKITAVDEEELIVLVHDRTGVTCFLGHLAGTFKGSTFAARMRYTRTWAYTDETGWRVVAAHASMI